MAPWDLSIVRDSAVTPTFCAISKAIGGLHAHSTHGMATSWARFQGVSVEEICAASHFHYILQVDVTAPTLSHTILSVGSLPTIPV